MARSLHDTDRAAVSQSVKHARLIEASRKLARIVKHTDPPPAVKRARTRLEKSLAKWLRHHGAEAFESAWSPDHIKVIAKIEAAINDGGLFAMAMPRGHGKSTLIKWTALYCLLTGRRKYVVIIAATADLAQDLVDFVRRQLQESDTLHAHYPHVTTYVRATEGKAIRARYQLRADGKPSGISWGKRSLVLPAVADADGKDYPANGAILERHG
jgi:reverse gyrase